jgi:CBS domain-containing protein
MADKVRDVMTDSVETVSPSDSAVDAAKKMKSADTGAVLVADDGELKGIVTDRDIVVGAVAEGKDPSDVKVEEIASTDTTTIEPDSDIDEAIKLMSEKKFRRLPVVEDGKPVGIISLGDLAAERDEGSALGEISQADPNN